MLIPRFFGGFLVEWGSMDGKFPKNIIEKIPFERGVLSQQALAEIIYQGEHLPKDKRFLRLEQGGVFRYFHINELFDKTSEKFYPYIKESSEIVALCELEKDPSDEMNFWIKFISVDPKFQGKGYATKLIETIMEFAKEKGVKLEASMYSEIGNERLKSVLHREADKLGIQVKDREKDL